MFLFVSSLTSCIYVYIYFNILRATLKSILKGEWHRRRRKERTRKRSSFIADPFGLTKKIDWR